MMCGCTEATPCVVTPEEGGEPEPCHWVSPGLCSAPDCMTKALNRHGERARSRYAAFASRSAGAEVSVEAHADSLGLHAIYSCTLDGDGQISRAQAGGVGEELAPTPPATAHVGGDDYTFRLIRYPEADEHGGPEVFAVEVNDAEGNLVGLGALDPFAQSPSPSLWVRCEKAPSLVIQALEARRQLYQPLQTKLTSDLTAADAAEHDLIVISVSREQVEASDYDTVARTLHGLVADGESARLYRDKVEVTIDGYGDDPRELWEIEQVSAFLRALSERFAFWFHICPPDSSTLRAIAFSVCRHAEVIKTPLGTGVRLEREDLARFLEIYFGALNDLYARLGIEESALQEVTLKVCAIFNLDPSEEGLPLGA